MYTMFGTARNNKNKIERNKKIKPVELYEYMNIVKR